MPRILQLRSIPKQLWMESQGASYHTGIVVKSEQKKETSDNRQGGCEVPKSAKIDNMNLVTIHLTSASFYLCTHGLTARDRWHRSTWLHGAC